MVDNINLKEITSKIIDECGGLTKMGRALGESAGTVYNWKKRGKIPHGKIVKIEKTFNIPRDRIRPDLIELFGDRKWRKWNE